MRGYCVGRPVALSVPKFSFAWNSFPVISFWRLICSFRSQKPHLFWDEGKLEAGVSEVLFPEPLLAEVDNLWVVLYVVVKCPGTETVAPCFRRSSHLATPSKVTSSWVGPIPPEVSTRSKLLENFFTSLRMFFYYLEVLFACLLVE